MKHLHNRQLAVRWNNAKYKQIRLQRMASTYYLALNFYLRLFYNLTLQLIYEVKSIEYVLNFNQVSKMTNPNLSHQKANSPDCSNPKLFLQIRPMLDYELLTSKVH